MAEGRQPYFYYEGNTTREQIASGKVHNRFLYIYRGPTLDMEHCALVNGYAYDKDQKMKIFLLPGEYWVILTKIILIENQIERINDKERCQKIWIKSFKETGRGYGTVQEISLFDPESVTEMKAPLGNDTELIVDTKKTVLKIYIPSRTGGNLKITADTAVQYIKLYYADGNDIDLFVKTAICKGEDNTMLVGEIQTAYTLTYAVPPNKFGWYYIKTDHASSIVLSSKFTIEAAAFDKHANSPWIPWNFWYYPFNPTLDKPHAFTPNGPCEHFDRRFGTSSLSWEKSNHSSEKANGTDGHCDDAGLASIMFMLPSTIPLDFTEEDFEFYATEYCRRACVTENIWSLDESARKIKPEIGRDATDSTIDSFHENLVRRLFDEKEPVFMDLRSVDDDRPDHPFNPNEVWNAAVYKFSAILSEHMNSEGNTIIIKVVNTLYTNDDNPTPNNKNPETGSGRKVILHYKVYFDATTGNVVHNPDQDWESVLSEGFPRQQLAPRYIRKFKGFRQYNWHTKSDKLPDIHNAGNPEITLSRLKTLGITLRGKYQALSPPDAPP
ncbi:MAG: hypothetical protein JW795_14095 [Chitinivibrionales bacterium]|nr:hypothetical protein [Chitinivibrionales bacterium]